MKTETLKLHIVSIDKVQDNCYITINNKQLQIKKSKFMLNVCVLKK